MTNLSAKDSFTNHTKSSMGPLNDTATILTEGPLFDEVHDDHMGIYIYPFVFVMFYMIVGFIGNSIVIYIFLIKWKLTKTTVFILTLAGVDLMSCVINMPTEAAILWNPINFDHDVMCKISRYTTFTASASSSFVLIAISIDRFLMVCKPFLGRELGVKYAKKTCLVAILVGLVTTCPSLIFYGTYTYYVEKSDPVTGQPVQIESRTCLISNFYVEHYRLPASFYFFLFGAHVIMFVILTMLYMLIGRSLFMSTSLEVSTDKRHSLKYFGLSMMSAITGTVPASPADQQKRESVVSRRSSRAVSIDNGNHRIDRGPAMLNGNNSRISTDTAVSICVNGDETPTEMFPFEHDRYPKLGNGTPMDNPVNNPPREENSANVKVDTTLSTDTDTGNTEAIRTRPVLNRNNLIVDPFPSDDSASESSINSPLKHKGKNLKLILDPDRSRSRNSRLSSASSASHTCALPMTPDTVRGILYRSQSVESRSRMNRIISDELRHVEVKEFSLRRNTLIMRMVTIAFVVSFLPYLVIVTMRYSNPDIPTKLSKAEQILYHVFLRTYFINSMINPFIYGFMNLEFRAKLKELFCAFCTKHNLRLPIKV